MAAAVVVVVAAELQPLLAFVVPEVFAALVVAAVTLLAAMEPRVVALLDDRQVKLQLRLLLTKPCSRNRCSSCFKSETELYL